MSDTAVQETQEPGTPAQRWWKRPEARAIFLLWLAFTIAGLALCWVPAWLMGQATSQQMDEVKDTMTALTAAASPVQALIWAFLLYSLVKWRWRGEGPPPDDTPGFRTNAPTVVVWVVASALLTLFVFVWGLLKIATVPTLGGFDAAPATAVPTVQVQVVGNQWVWTFRYPELGGIESARLVLPANERTNFTVTSVDVIHSFWIPTMGVKVDANPGALTYTSVTPHSVGSSTVRCAELCGILHAAMQTQVDVLSPADFQAWVKDQQAKLAAQPPAPPVEEEGGA